MSNQCLILRCLITIAPLLLPQIGHTSPNHPVTDLPICYVKTTDDKLIDLTNKCGFIKPAACASSLGSASRDRVLADFCERNNRCLLNNACDDIPRGINTPPLGTPMGFGFSQHLVAHSII